MYQIEISIRNRLKKLTIETVIVLVEIVLID